MSCLPKEFTGRHLAVGEMRIKTRSPVATRPKLSFGTIQLGNSKIIVALILVSARRNSLNSSARLYFIHLTVTIFYSARYVRRLVEVSVKPLTSPPLHA